MGQAAARRRNRVRRLDRLGQRAPGCIQGPARRQACAGSRCGAPGRCGGNGDEETCTEAIARKTAQRQQDAQHHDERRTERRHGRADLETGQGAVAECRRRQACHQARSRPLLRERRRVDDAAHRGAAVFDHPRTRRHRRAALLPASRNEGHVESADVDARVRRLRAVPAGRSHRGPGSLGAERGGRAAPVELRAVPARRAGAADLRSRSEPGGCRSTP